VYTGTGEVILERPNNSWAVLSWFYLKMRIFLNK
jgi:hypothetical protein